MENKETKEELLEKYNQLAIKYDSLKDEIYKRTIENENLIKNLKSIEDQYKSIYEKIKEFN